MGFEMNLIVVEAIRGRCASFTVLTATVSEIFGGQTTPIYFSSIDVSLFICCLIVHMCHCLYVV